MSPSLPPAWPPPSPFLFLITASCKGVTASNGQHVMGMTIIFHNRLTFSKSSLRPVENGLAPGSGAGDGWPPGRHEHGGALITPGWLLADAQMPIEVGNGFQAQTSLQCPSDDIFTEGGGGGGWHFGKGGVRSEFGVCVCVGEREGGRQ